MKGSKSRCACYAGTIGVGLCTILMSLSMVGVAFAALSKNVNIENMNSMSSMNMDALLQNSILSFFDGIGGEIILIASFGSMLAGMGFSGNRKLLPIVIVGTVILYISMYQYYSIGLQIAGALIMVFVHLPVYSYRFSKMLKLA